MTLKQIKNYKYYVRLLREPDDLFWDQARLINALWNKMVEIRSRFLSDFAPLYDNQIEDNILSTFQVSAKKISENLPEKRHHSIFGKNTEPTETKDLTLSQVKKLFWLMFEKELVKLTRLPEWKTRLCWEAREAILERFRTSSANALKAGVELKFQSNRIDKISFYHRFSEGGLDTDRVFIHKSKKVKLTALPDSVYADESHQNRKSRYSKGCFGIGTKHQPLPISVYMHRPLPKGKIKTVQFLGTFSDLTREWEWKILFAVQSEKIGETPPLNLLRRLIWIGGEQMKGIYGSRILKIPPETVLKSDYH